MKKLIDAVSPHIGPKLTAVLAGGTTLTGQVERALTLSADSTVTSVIADAVTRGDLSALLPAPVAAVVGYVARKSDNPDNSEPELVSGITVPSGAELDDLSDVPNPNANEWEGDEEFFSYRQLIDGEHLPPEPVGEEVILQVIDEKVRQQNHVIDTINMALNDVANEIEYKFKKLDEYTTGLSKQISGLQTDLHSAEYNMNRTDKSSLNTHNRRIATLEQKTRPLQEYFDDINARINRITKRVESLENPPNEKLIDSEHEQRAESVDSKIHVIESVDDIALSKHINSLPFPKDNGFVFSQRSLNNLVGVHEHQVEIAKRALELTKFDFIITRGLATQAEQAALMRKRPKVTWTKNSRHLYGLAVDVAAIDENGEVTWKMPYYVEIAHAFKQAAKELGYPTTSGILDWGKDGPHHELDKTVYPDDGSLRIDDPFKY